MRVAHALLQAAAGAPGLSVAPPITQQWPGHVPGKVYLGTSEVPGRYTQNTVQEIGADLGLEREFYVTNNDAAAEDAFITGAHSRNRIPWISWKASQNDADVQADWASVSAGTQDAAITARVNRYKAHQKPIIVTWNGQPDRDGTTITHGNNWRAAYKHMANLFAGATNVAFVPIMSDYLWHTLPADGTASGTIDWWLDAEMLSKSAFLGIRSDKNDKNETYADRCPVILSWLDGKGYPDMAIGFGLTATYTTSLQSAAAWWNESWNWVTQNIYRVAAIAYHNTNATPPPPEAGSRPQAPANLRISSGPTDTSVNLAWDAPISDLPITAYRLYRNGVSVGTVGGSFLTASMTGLTAGTDYTFNVSAESQNGEGPKSNTLAVRTTGGTSTGGGTPTSSVVLYAAGDIGQMEQYQAEHGQQLTGPIIKNDTTKTGVLAMGDIAYTDGTYAEFMQNYDPFWGDFKNITYPAPGNHEYKTLNAAGYFQYFNTGSKLPANAKWYSFDLGAWHCISLDSDTMGSTQLSWLDADLAKFAQNKATRPGLLAFFHHARWTSIVRDGGGGGGTSTVQPFIDKLTAAKCDLILQAHDHAYERFGQLNATGSKVTNGSRHFVIGTGGRGFYNPGPVHPSSEYRLYDTWGVVKFTLTATNYSWLWRPVSGTSADSGTTPINPK